jgi:DNA-binding LacI/PurR family transcriptional regulator
MPDLENKAVTIDDVARLAGVSVSTVSRILNDKPDVAERTRQHVLQVIEQTGYTPHVGAQRLAGGRSSVITLLFPMDHAEFSQFELDFFIGAASAASKHNYFFNLMTEPMDPNSLLNLYRSGQVDGVILMQIRLDDWRPALLREHGYPFVMIGRCAVNDGYSFIDMDFERAIRMAFENLVGLGHQQIGFLGRPSWMREAQLGPACRFWNGYQQALEQFGLQPCYREVTHLTVQDGEIATLELLDECPETTAFVTVHGATANGIIRALRERGRKVPRDCSVVALATNKIAQLVTPPLTHINFPSDAIGYQAAQMLVKLLNSRSRHAQELLLEPTLTVRDSTSTPPHLQSTTMRPTG